MWHRKTLSGFVINDISESEGESGIHLREMIMHFNKQHVPFDNNNLYF